MFLSHSGLQVEKYKEIILQPFIQFNQRLCQGVNDCKINIIMKCLILFS